MRAACVYALRGDSDAALDSLEKAARMRRLFTIERARLDPDFASLRGEARFRALMGEPAG